MKIDILVLVYCSLLLTNLFARQVEVKEYRSPAEFNRKIAGIEGLQEAWIPIYKEQINATEQQVYFLDQEGKLLKTTTVMTNLAQNVRIDTHYKRAIFTKPEIIKGKISNYIHDIKAYHQEVFNANGELLFRFDNDIFWLMHFSESFFLGSSEGPEMGYFEKSILTDSNGNIIREIPHLCTPKIVAGNDDLIIVNDMVKSTLWAFDHSANLLWKKKIVISEEVSMSIDGKICFSPGGNIIVLDKTGAIINKNTIFSSKHGGSVKAKIAKDGRKIFWIRTSRKTLENRYKSCQLVLYNLETEQREWELTLLADVNRGWAPMSFGISDSGKSVFVKFYKSDLVLYGKKGEVLYREPLNETGAPEKVLAKFVGDILILTDTGTIHLKTVNL